MLMSAACTIVYPAFVFLNRTFQSRLCFEHKAFFFQSVLDLERIPKPCFHFMGPCEGGKSVVLLAQCFLLYVCSGLSSPVTSRY